MEGEVLKADASTDVSVSGVVGTLQCGVHLEELVCLGRGVAIGGHADVRGHGGRTLAEVAPNEIVTPAFGALKVLKWGPGVSMCLPHEIRSEQVDAAGRVGRPVPVVQ